MSTGHYVGEKMTNPKTVGKSLTNPKMVYTLTLTAQPKGKKYHTSIMTVLADSKEEAIKGLQDYIAGKVRYNKITRKGLDLTKEEKESKQTNVIKKGLFNE